MSTTDPAVPTSGGGEIPDSLIDFLLSARSMPPDDLPAAIDRCVAALGGSDAHVLLSDLSQRTLRRLGDHHTTHPIDGSPAGDAFRTESAVVTEDESGIRVSLPIYDSMRVGVLSLSLPAVPDGDMLVALGVLAAVAGELISTKQQYGDGITLTRRSDETSLAAEIRWELLPPLSYSSELATVSGMLEPAYDIAGDTFDYAVNGDHLHFAIFDAIGHGLEASQMASLAVMSYRHSRLHGRDLLETLAALDEVVLDQFGESKYVTAQLGRLDLLTGRLRVISAGHPRPLRVARGGAAEELPCIPYVPAGLGRATLSAGEELTVDLSPQDWVLFYSDGITESRSPGGDFFGGSRLAERFARLVGDDYPAGEVTRVLVRDVLEHQASPLRDDATLLVFRWDGPRA